MESRRTPHILVVDDDEPASRATTRMLESLGYRSTCETQSVNALRDFSEDPDAFDCAIIEPLMPQIMGIELAIRFRRIRPGFPVLFYGGYFDEPCCRRIEVDHLGRMAYKPLSSKELADEIRAMMRDARIPTC